MKVFFGLLALAVAASAVTDVYGAGKQYEYQYKSHSLSGIPLVSNDRTGISLWTKVQLFFHQDDQLVLQLADPEIRQLNWQQQQEEQQDLHRVPELDDLAVISDDRYSELPSDIRDQILTHLRRPVRFTRTAAGHVRDIQAHQDEPDWCLNMKKAIISNFQLQKINQLNTVREDVITGEQCEVNYDVTRNETDSTRKTITKVFSLDKCDTRSSFRDVIGLQGHRLNQEDDIIRSSFVSTHDVVEKNNRYFIRRAVSEGRIIVRPFSPESGEMVTYTRQELHFVREVTKDIKVPTDVVKRCDSLFTRMQTEQNQFSDVYTEIISETQKVDIIKELLVRAVEKMNSEEVPLMKVEDTQEVMHAIKLMRTLKNKDSFRQLVQHFWQHEKQQQMRPTIVSVLSFCGSPALVEALPLIKSELTTPEFNMIITALPSTHVPSKDTLVLLKDLYTSGKDETTCRQLLLTIGSQVHDMCKTLKQGQFLPRSPCTQEIKTLAKRFFETEYEKTTHETRRLVILKAIGNSGLDMTDFLRKIIVDTQVPTTLRVNCIYALRRLTLEEPLKEILLPVYRNEKNLYPVELRIAAFNVLVERIPTEKMLNILVAQLNLEESRQLGNYVYSYLKNLIDLPTIYAPTKDLTIAAQTLLPTVQRYEDGIWYSKNLQYVITSLSRRFANFIEMNLVNSNTQSLPRSMNLRMTKYLAGFYMELLEGGFRLEGLDRLVKEIVTYVDPSSDLVKTLVGDRFSRDIVTMHSILSDSDIVDTKTEKTTGYMFLKYLGNEIGVFCTEDFSLSEIKDLISYYTTLENTIDYFNLRPLAHATIKVQTMVGMPVVCDWTTFSVLGLRRSRKIQTTETALVNRYYEPRFLIQGYGRMGVDMGLFKTTIGQRMHIKLNVPFNVRVVKEDKRVQLEAFLAPETRLTRPELIEALSVPMKMNEMMESTKQTYRCEKRDLVLPTIQGHYKYETEYKGVNMRVESTNQDFTYLLPSSPFTGRHIFRIQLVNNKPLPLGLKAELTYSKTDDKYIYTGLWTLNPRVQDIKYELTTVMTYKITEDYKPVISLEVEPKWQSKTYRFFSTFEIVSGKINPGFSWIEASEEKPIEFNVKCQWGINKQYVPEEHDLVIKSVLKKSDLQKLFELRDSEIEDSDCYKCEQYKQSFRNIHCERCIYKRSWLSQIDSKVFLNKDKVYDFEYVKPLFYYVVYPYYNMLETYRLRNINQDSVMTTDLVSTEHHLLNSCMRHMMANADNDLISFRLINDFHLYGTQQNITFVNKDQKIIFTQIPLIPAWRRLYNLPLYRLTDVITDRIVRPNYGKCMVDQLNKVHTLDTVVYDLPKETPKCEQILVKDITKDRELEITSMTVENNKRTLKLHLGEKILVEIVPVTSGYEVRINGKAQTWKNDVVETELVRVVRVTIQSPQKTPVDKIILFVKNQMIQCELIDQYVSVRMPFWYKNQLTGLCGDFNGEKSFETRRLPNGHITDNLHHYIQMHSSQSCHIHSRQ